MDDTKSRAKVIRPEIIGDMVRIRADRKELLQGYEIAWSEKVQGCLRQERGDEGTGISEKSPKTLLPNRGGGGAIPPAEATESPTPTSFLTVPTSLLHLATAPPATH